MTIETAIDNVKKADISNDDWVDDILNQIDDPFTKGYLTAKVEELGNSLSNETEEYRGELIIIMEDFSERKD